MRLALLIFIYYSFLPHSPAGVDSFSYEKNVRPTLEKRCISCHNTNRPKANVNIDNYKEQERVIKDGAFWLKVLDVIKKGSMPPKTEPTMSANDYSTLVTGIDKILKRSLEKKTPGQVVIRRLSHSEYQHTIKDLFDVEIDAYTFFPSDGSGGAGFDNQGRALFITPLKMERYYDAADLVVESIFANKAKLQSIIPFQYNPTGLSAIFTWVRSFFDAKFHGMNDAKAAAEKVIVPVASKAYRKFLREEEKAHLITLFDEVYKGLPLLKNPQRFNQSIAQVLKAILVSPNFIYKVEEEPELNTPYPLGNFEVANRLSYFLWNSMPDQELFELAHKGKLHDTSILAHQVIRMLADPKSKRFAESFATQWLGIKKLLDAEPLVDEEKFPGFDMDIRKDLYNEAVEFFYHVLTKRKNFLDLIDSDYSILNKRLAEYYGIQGVMHEDFERVALADKRRGGVLGMASVLSSTSLSLRTSPVLRGKWVLEQILGTPPPPPPDVVSPLTEDKKVHEAIGLRKILELHRANTECRSCHEKMDPLGLGLENYDPIGQWRDTYEKVPVDASGITETGKPFNGPNELKKILIEEKEKFARNLSVKMLSYALGRSTIFTDEPALVTLENTLLQNNFNPEPFLIELVKSYVFLTKINDFEKKQNI